MFLISCPYCGDRDQIEFRYGGEAHVPRPDPESVDDAQWADYLFGRANPKGFSLERWVHEAGCGQWFNLARNTADHQIAQTYPMGRPAPESLKRERAR
jgi:heterotetrameric sarcosine oxidase delta subunit